jgi:hypothetical protein
MKRLSRKTTANKDVMDVIEQQLKGFAKKRNIEDMDLQDINKIDHSLYVKELLRRYPELCD